MVWLVPDPEHGPGDLATQAVVTGNRSRLKECESDRCPPPRARRGEVREARLLARSRAHQSPPQPTPPSSLPHLNATAAGIDVGATAHVVAVPADRDAEPVREFGPFTNDLDRLSRVADRVRQRDRGAGVDGVSWIPLFQVLEERGFEVKLVDARQLTRVPGRKSDCARLPVAPAPAHVRAAGRRVPTGRSDLRRAQLHAAARDAGGVRRAARPAPAEGAGPDEPPAPGGPRRRHRGDRDEEQPRGAGWRTRPAPARRVAAWAVHARRGDHRRGDAGGWARGAPVRARAGGRAGRAPRARSAPSCAARPPASAGPRRAPPPPTRAPAASTPCSPPAPPSSRRARTPTSAPPPPASSAPSPDAPTRSATPSSNRNHPTPLTPSG